MNHRRLILLLVLLAVTVTSLTPGVRGDTPLNGLRDAGGGKGSFLYNPGAGPFLYGNCFVANQTLTPSTVSFTIGNNTLVGGAVVLSGTLQAEISSIPYTAGGSCASQGDFLTSNTLRIQDVLKNSFTAISFTFPQTYVVQKNGGYFIGLEVTYNSDPGGSHGVELESNSGSGQFDTSQSGCTTPSGNGCTGSSNCGTFESCALYLLNGVPVASQGGPPTVSSSAPPASSAPVYVPVGAPVSQQAISPTFVQTPGPFVDSLPIIYIAVILFTLTLGAYLLTSKDLQKKLKEYSLTV